MRNLLVIGAGGHGAVIADVAAEIGVTDIAFLDDRYPEIKQNFGWPILGVLQDAEQFVDKYPFAVVAIGNGKIRANLTKHLCRLNYKLVKLIHPTAYISSKAVIEKGSVVLAQAVVNVGSRIGAGCIINTGATVDHHCILEAGVHICPGVNLAGEVQVGAYSWIGIGAAVINRISIGSNVIVGAGAVVIRDVLDNTTVVGNPGRVISKPEVTQHA